MTKSERRYFKVSMARSSAIDESKFNRLFDVMHAQEVYSEEEVLRKGNLNPVKLANDKKRLYDYILSSLQQFYKNHGIERQIAQLLDRVEILYLKGLYKQATALINKAEKLAEKNGHDLALVKILNWERKLAVYTNSASDLLTKSMQHLTRSVIDDMSMLSIINQLQTSIYEVFCKEGRVAKSAMNRKKVRLLMKEGFDQIDYDGLNVVQQMKFNRAIYTGFMLLGEGRKASARADLNRQLYLENAETNSLSADDFLHAYNQMIISMNQQKMHEAALSIIDELKMLPSTYPVFETTHYQSKIFDFSAFHELEAYLGMENKQEVEKALPLLEKQLVRNGAYLNPVNIQSKKYRIALGCFFLGDYRAAIKRLQELLHYDSSKARNDIRESIELLYVLSHYALGNWEVLENQLSLFKRKLESIDNTNPGIQLILNNFLSRLNDGTTHTDMSASFADELECIELKNPKGVQTLAYFNLAPWFRWQLADGPGALVRVH